MASSWKCDSVVCAVTQWHLKCLQYFTCMGRLWDCFGSCASPVRFIRFPYMPVQLPRCECLVSSQVSWATLNSSSCHLCYGVRVLTSLDGWGSYLRNKEHNSSHHSLRSCLLVVSSWPLLTCMMVIIPCRACDWQIALPALLSSLLPAPLTCGTASALAALCAHALLNPWDVLVATLLSELSWTSVPTLGSPKAVSRSHCLYWLRGISMTFWSCSWRY